MLNAIPDSRNADDRSEVFLAPNEEIDNERKTELAAAEKFSTHDTIDLVCRRFSSFSTSKSDSSPSTEVPNMASTVEIGNISFFFRCVWSVVQLSSKKASYR